MRAIYLVLQILDLPLQKTFTAKTRELSHSFAFEQFDIDRNYQIF